MKNCKCPKLLLAAVFCTLIAAPAAQAGPQVLCAKNDRVVVRARCRSEETKLTLSGLRGIQGEQGPAGPTGATGAAGAAGEQGAQGAAGAAGVDGSDGMDAAWGDGSAGDFLLESVSYVLAIDNQQYDDFTVPAGTTLHVPSGTIIRCKGTFTNAGTIDVLGPAQSSVRKDQTPSTVDAAITLPLVGVALAPAGLGDLGAGGAAHAGGEAAAGLDTSTDSYRNITRPMIVFGGSGGPGQGGGSRGGSGGGGLAVYCEGAIVNTGLIAVRGNAGATESGGGGGGVVILASKTSVTNSGTDTIDVSGGDGTDAEGSTGACGGGGGGLVHILAPVINVPAESVNVDGGSGGTGGLAVTVSGASWAGGSSGGASVGTSGAGGAVNDDGSAAAAGNGMPGVLVKRIVSNPAGLL